MARLLWWLLAVGLVVAQQPQVNYFVQINGGVSLPWGALDGRGQVVAAASEVLVAETVDLSRPLWHPLVEMRVGANINASAVAFSLLLAQPVTRFAGENSTEPSSLLGTNFLYAYHWDMQPVQPVLGLGYGFNRLKIPQAVQLETSSGQTELGEVLFSGAGPLFNAGLNFPVNDHLHIVFDNRVALFWISNLTTPANDYTRLDKDLWQWFASSSLALKIIF